MSDDPDQPPPSADPDLDPVLELDLQWAATDPDPPDEQDFAHWIRAALAACDRRQASLTLRVVEPDESRQLNRAYRGVDAPTNVLAFPFEPPPGLDPADPAAAEWMTLLGDVVICAAAVRAEARAQGKPLAAHWAHLVIHGVLHLLGHDHRDDAEARRMETLETRILDTLGFPPPYETT